MESISMHCKSIPQIQLGAYIFWAESYFTGRAYRGKVLIQVWLQSNKK